jgi:ABC-type nitrate/sulfonate/bicarbonate transport system substrate-binding protein
VCAVSWLRLPQGSPVLRRVLSRQADVGQHLINNPPAASSAPPLQPQPGGE